MQSLHSVLRSASWNLPASHLVHDSCIGWALYVPGAQGLASAEPTEQNVPFGQTTHCSTLDITASIAFLCVPPGQGRAAAAPSAQ